MLDKLRELALRHEDLEAQLADPAVYGDAGRLRSINRELKELAPIVETWHAWEEAERDRAEARGMVEDFLNENRERGWVIDGNYANFHQERRMAEADLILLICSLTWEAEPVPHVRRLVRI